VYKLLKILYFSQKGVMYELLREGLYCTYFNRTGAKAVLLFSKEDIVRYCDIVIFHRVYSTSSEGTELLTEMYTLTIEFPQ
jgi:hypothetical protein